MIGLITMTSKVKINDNSKLECFIAQFTNIDFKLDSGVVLENLTIAYKTFGKLNEDRYYRAFQLNDYQLLSEQQTQ